MAMKSKAFACEHLSKAYRTRGGLVLALEDVTFRVGEQEFVCLVGPSGCGKTTLLKLIAGLLEPTSGQIAFADRRGRERPGSALVFQEHGLFPWMTVLDNVAFGLEMQGVRPQERYALARAFIDKVGLSSFAHSYPHELSVGMRQRVGIARAFVADAPILLMDEPFGSLDAQTRRVLQVELLRLWKEHRKVVVYVTHDIEEAVLLGDRVLVMTDRPGSIREDIPIPLGRPRDLVDTDRTEIKEIRWHVWTMLENQVREDLHIPA
jgi:NitT/TauT family transport system ATP-binding protein